MTERAAVSSADMVGVDVPVPDDLARHAADPLAFVEAVFPWGQGELRSHAGPDDWQRDVLSDLTDALRSGGPRRREPIRLAIASGHGVGKSALVSWLILWSISTRAESKGVVTANTERQLRTKTWVEVGKWHRLMQGREMLKLGATALSAADKDLQNTWRVDMVPWNERATEAFAGLHNHGKRIALFFDEASAIDDRVWETAEGALTDEDTEILWFVCGNPTRNKGRFKDCFHRFRHRWIRRQVDSRQARLTNKEQIAGWIADYGEESDFVRVRVRGVFPHKGPNQFIATADVEAAIARVPAADEGGGRLVPVVIGVDVARYGDDQSVILVRKGRAVLDVVKFRNKDTWEVAQHVAERINRWQPDAVFVDGGGVGGGVVDALRRMHFPVTEVLFGSKALRDTEYANRRAEMWGEMRKWLQTGCLPEDRELADDLTGPEYSFVRENVIQLERKADMKLRGLASPDTGDALALTFAQPVRSRASSARDGTLAANTDFEVWND
ncbi:terminase [Hwanghaeella sp.]|uniref:terminase n=1 Tax=Hwanghaeella sp. TaxID=2605943 RepID=UPI003CCBDF97